MQHRTKIFLANVGIIFGIVFLTGLSIDALCGSAVEIRRNILQSLIAAALAALAQAKSYIDANPDSPGNGPRSPEPGKACKDPSNPHGCKPKRKGGPPMQLFMLIPW